MVTILSKKPERGKEKAIPSFFTNCKYKKSHKICTFSCKYIQAKYLEMISTRIPKGIIHQRVFI